MGDANSMGMDLLTPVWIRQVAYEGNAGSLTYRKCLCGVPVLECSVPPVWGKYDVKLIHGVDDLTVAIILGVPLDELRWNQGLRRAGIYTTLRYKTDKYYVQTHECHHMPFGTVPDSFAFPEREEAANSIWVNTVDDSSREELDEFTRLWYKEAGA